MNCPNCGRSNPADNVYCSKCGLRLPNAAARGAGITYRRTEQTEPRGGGGQGMLAFGAVLLAGLLFAVGAITLLVSAPPAASPTAVANASVENSLPIFVQPTPTPTVPPSPTPVPSFSASPSLLPSGLESPTPIVPTPTPTTSQATPTPTPTPTRTPTAPPSPTPTLAPANCAQADGSNMRTIFLGFGNDESRIVPRAWCIRTVTIRPFLEFGKSRLLVDGRRLAAYTCSPGTCQLENRQDYSPPRLVTEGSTLQYRFTCADNPFTPEVDECNDGLEGGATIQIDYEPLPGP